MGRLRFSTFSNFLLAAKNFRLGVLCLFGGDWVGNGFGNAMLVGSGLSGIFSGIGVGNGCALCGGLAFLGLNLIVDWAWVGIGIVGEVWVSSRVGFLFGSGGGVGNSVFLGFGVFFLLEKWIP